MNVILDEEVVPTSLAEGKQHDDPFTLTRLQHLAGEIYQSTTPSSSHPVITFSYTKETDEGEENCPIKRLSFRPIENIDIHKDSQETSMLAIPVEDQELPYIFPYSPMLRYR